MQDLNTGPPPPAPSPAKIALDIATANKKAAENLVDQTKNTRDTIQSNLSKDQSSLAYLTSNIAKEQAEIVGLKADCANEKAPLITLIRNLASQKLTTENELSAERSQIKNLENALIPLSNDLNKNQDYVDNSPAAIQAAQNTISTLNDKISSITLYKTNTLTPEKTRLTTVIQNATTKIAEDTQNLATKNTELATCRYNLTLINIGVLSSVEFTDQEDYRYKHELAESIEHLQRLGEHLPRVNNRCAIALALVTGRLSAEQNSIENAENVALTQELTRVKNQLDAYLSSAQSDLTSYTSTLATVNSNIASKNAEINTCNSQADSFRTQTYQPKLDAFNATQNDAAAIELHEASCTLENLKKSCELLTQQLQVLNTSRLALEPILNSIPSRITTLTSLKTITEDALSQVGQTSSTHQTAVNTLSSQRTTKDNECSAFTSATSSDTNIITRLQGINITLESAKANEDIAREKWIVSLKILNDAKEALEKNCSDEQNNVVVATAKLATSNRYKDKLVYTDQKLDEQFTHKDNAISLLQGKIQEQNTLITQINANVIQSRAQITLDNTLIANQTALIETEETTVLVTIINKLTNIIYDLTEAYSNLRYMLINKSKVCKKLDEEVAEVVEMQQSSQALTVKIQTNTTNLPIAQAAYNAAVVQLNLAITAYNDAKKAYYG